MASRCSEEDFYRSFQQTRERARNPGDALRAGELSAASVSPQAEESAVLMFSSKQLPPGDRNALVQQAFEPTYQMLPVEGSPLIDAQVGSLVCHEMLICSVEFGALRGVRSSARVDDSGVDQYLLQCVDVGGIGFDDGRQMHSWAGTGDIALIDLSRSYAMEVPQSMRGVCLFLPREAVEASVLGRAFHGQALRGSSPLTRLLHKQLTTLWREVQEMDGYEVLAAQEMMLDLLGSGFRHALEVAQQPAEQHLRARIEAYVIAHLREPALDAAQLQQHFGISRAHLYRLFANEGGVGTYIRKRRLDRCLREILLARADRPLGAIACAWGFSNDQQFLRAFRKQFGMTPMQARRTWTEVHPDASMQRLLSPMNQARVGSRWRL